MASSKASRIILQPVADKPKSEAKVRAGRLGGLTVAQRYCRKDSDWAKARASKGGNSTLARYGREYFVFLNTKKPKRSPNRPVIERIPPEPPVRGREQTA